MGAAHAGAAPAVHAAAVAAPAGAYVPVGPIRVTDTRAASGEPNAGKTLGPAGSVSVGLESLVPATATAVALSVTAVDGTTRGFLRVLPAGSPPGGSTSAVNYAAGRPGCNVAGCVVANLVLTALGPGGVTVQNGGTTTGTVDVVVDLEGYFDPTGATTSGAGHFYPLAPARVADTRCRDSPAPPAGPCAGQTLPGSGALGANQSFDLVVAGQGGVPSTGVAAVVVQLTATDTTAPGYLTAFASGSAPPLASNVNFGARQSTSTRAIVAVGANGAITIRNSSGSTDVVVDVDGYFSTGAGSPAAGSLFTPVPPARLVDTRIVSAVGIPPDTSGPLLVAGRAGIAAATNGGSTAVVLNVTEASATATGYLTVTPTVTTPPAVTSDLNFGAAGIRANADLAGLDATGSISIYNYAGDTQVVVDAFGYFAAVPNPPLTVTLSPGSGRAGSTVIVTATSSATVTALGVTGCGLTAVAGTPGAGAGTFSFTILAVEPAGPCSLTFAGIVNGGQLTAVATAVFTVTPTNQSYTVTPGTPQNVIVSTTGTGGPSDTQGRIAYTATGLGTTAVDIELFQAGTVTDSNGSYSFASSAGVARPGAVASAVTAVDGTPRTPPAALATDVTPVSGQVTFTVDSTTAESDYPVVFAKASGNDNLAVDPGGSPTQSFGVGGLAVWNAPAALSGTYVAQTVSSVDPAKATFEAGSMAGGPPTSTFSYDQPSSSYTYGAGPTLDLSEATFASYLSSGDVVNAVYNAAGPSSFTLTKDVPAAPARLAASFSPLPAGVILTWIGPGNPDVASYTVERADVILPVHLNFGSVGPFSAITGGSGQPANPTVTTFTDIGATSGSTYRYEVVANGSGANGSGPASATAQATVP
ncbi:MAG: beta strand repeat-containing protein [Acidimicrobiales bacterium]